MLQLKHNTTDFTIERSTVAELKETLMMCGWIYDAVRCEKKDTLSMFAKRERDTLKAKHDAEQARLEEERLSQLHAEVALGAAKIAHEAIASMLREQYNEDKATITKFQAEIAAANPEWNNIVQCIEWQTDDVFLAWERMDQIAGIAVYFEKQATEQTKTVAEIHEFLSDCAQSSMDSALSVSTSQSTNPVRNVRDMQALKAKGWFAKLMTRLHKCYPEIVAGQTDKAKYLGFCL